MSPAIVLRRLAVGWTTAIGDIGQRYLSGAWPADRKPGQLPSRQEMGISLTVTWSPEALAQPSDPADASPRPTIKGTTKCGGQPGDPGA